MARYRRITPEGTRDLLFEECLARREAQARLADLFVGRGFSEVMTPGLEFLDVFRADGDRMADGMAIPVESMYKLGDDKGRLLVVRPDSTMPIARLAATRLRGAELPLRLYYTQDVYRMNHGLTGRSDQEFQAGVELIGAAGERADLEIVALAAEALQGCGGEYRLEIGHIGFFQSLAAGLGAPPETVEELRALIETKSYAALADALDCLPGGPAAEGLRRLPRLFGGEEVLAAAAPLCTAGPARQALAYLQKLYAALCALGLKDQVMIDLGMVHRNEYYTGVIFRGYIEGNGEAVVSGGRYDTLLGQFGTDRPATGFGVNVDAFAKAMLARGEVDPPLPPEVLVHAQPGYETAALQKAAELTGEGMICETSVFDTLEAALGYAAGRGIDKVIEVGGELAVYEVS